MKRFGKLIVHLLKGLFCLLLLVSYSMINDTVSQFVSSKPKPLAPVTIRKNESIELKERIRFSPMIVLNSHDLNVLLYCTTHDDETFENKNPIPPSENDEFILGTKEVEYFVAMTDGMRVAVEGERVGVELSVPFSAVTQISEVKSIMELPFLYC